MYAANYGLVAEALKSCDWMSMSNMDLDNTYKFFKAHITQAVAKCSKKTKVQHKKNLYNVH